MPKSIFWTLCVPCFTAFLVAVPGAGHGATILINNGLDCSNPGNVIDDDTYQSDDVYVRNAWCPPSGAVNPDDPCPLPGVQTGVCLVDEARLSQLNVMDSSSVALNDAFVEGQLSAHDSSAITMSDASVWTLGAYDSSTVTWTGGSGVVFAYGSSTVTLSNGGSSFFSGIFAYGSSTVTVNDWITPWSFAYDFSTITMNSGWVDLDLWATDFSTFIVNGGGALTMGASGSSTIILNGGFAEFGLGARDSSTVIMNGGALGQGEFVGLGAYDSSTVTMNGGWVGRLEAHDSSTIWVVGREFEVDGVPVPYGDLTAQTGTLTGTLALGDPMDNEFYQGGWTGEPCYSPYPCTGTITLAPPVAVDIKPWSEINPIDPMSRGVIEAAILGSEDFDVAEVDVTTLAFGPNGVPPAFDLTNRWVYFFSHWDVNGDGNKDLLSHYRTEETGIAMGDTEACLSGETLEGRSFQSCDAITTVPRCGHGFEAALVVPPLVWLSKRRRRKRA